MAFYSEVIFTTRGPQTVSMAGLKVWVARAMYGIWFDARTAMNITCC